MTIVVILVDYYDDNTNSQRWIKSSKTQRILPGQKQAIRLNYSLYYVDIDI